MSKTKHIKLLIIRNYFPPDVILEHLGFEYRGIYYFISHSKSAKSILIPKEELKMPRKSEKDEYLRKCHRKPTIARETNLFITLNFVKEAHLKLSSNDKI